MRQSFGLWAAALLVLALAAARPAAARSKYSTLCINVGEFLTGGVRVEVGGVDSYDW